VLVGERFLDRSVGDDDEPGIVVVEELQSDELRCKSRATATLPLGAVGPHVVVDDQLRSAVEDVGQADWTVGADQGVVSQFDHRQPPPLGGDGIQFAGGGLLALA